MCKVRLVKNAIILTCVFHLLACTNTKNANTLGVPSEISGIYVYDPDFTHEVCLKRANENKFCGKQSIQLNDDGSGFLCVIYHHGLKIKTTLRHAGEGLWVGPCCKKSVTKNMDGSIFYGSEIFKPGNHVSPRCKN